MQNVLLRGAPEDIPAAHCFQELPDRRLRPAAGERFAPFADPVQVDQKDFLSLI